MGTGKREKLLGALLVKTFLLSSLMDRKFSPYLRVLTAEVAGPSARNLSWSATHLHFPLQFGK